MFSVFVCFYSLIIPVEECMQNKRLFKETRLLHPSDATEAQLVERISLNFDYILFQNKQQQKHTKMGRNKKYM